MNIHDSYTANPHNCVTVADAYKLGRTLEPGFYSGCWQDARDAYANWTAAESDHAETSYFGRENIRKSRAYFLGILRAVRAS